MPGGWAPGALVKRSNAPNGMEVGIDFPFVCETCLGPNPYVRMVKSPPGNKLCKISGRPFQSFRWRAGPGGRWKECMVEASVAKDKNVCQACLVDMTYGVPVGVRDALLEAGADASGSQLQKATSDPNSAYYWQQKDQLALNSAGGGQAQNLEPSRQLLHLARSIQANTSNSAGPGGGGKAGSQTATAWRNLPKLCSFWLAGTCTRVVQHKCPFRPCCGTFEFPELAATHRELRFALIDRLKKEGAVEVMRSHDPETKEALHEAGKGNKEEAIKKRYEGSDELTTRYLRKAKEQLPDLEPPKDESITSLWVGGVEAGVVGEQDLRDAFYSFGEVRSVKVLAEEKKCAFVDFASREGAEAAAKGLHKNLFVKGLRLQLDWAKPQSLSARNGSSSGGGEQGAQVALPPPPGMPAHAPLQTLDPAMQQRLQMMVQQPPPSSHPAYAAQMYYPPAPPGAYPMPSGASLPPPPPPRAPAEAGGGAPSAKKARVDEAAAAPPPGPPPPRGGAPPPPPGPPPSHGAMPKYPSMNPTRMGAKPGAN